MAHGIYRLREAEKMLNSGDWVTVRCEKCKANCKGYRETKGKRFPVDGQRFQVYRWVLSLVMPNSGLYSLRGPHGLFACPEASLEKEE
jgi:hypothetical protein